MRDRAEQLALRVRGVERIGLVRTASVTLAVVALMVGAAFVVASILDVAFWLPMPVRALLLAGTVAAVAYLASKAYRAGAAQFGNEADAARAVEGSFPQIERSLSTAIEYGNDPEKTAKYSSSELVDELVASTDARTFTLPFRKAVSWRALVRALGAALAVALVLVVYALTLPHMARATALRFFSPLSDVPPPTWTVIDLVAPGAVEVPRGRSVRIDVTLSGAAPAYVRLMVRGESESEWSGSEMAPNGERTFTRTLARVVRATEYRVQAGDATSRAFEITPVDEPRVESIRVKIEPPAYTGLPPAELTEGSGDVRAPVGTRVEVTVRANVAKASGRLELELGKERAASAVELARVELTPRDLGASFTLSESGEYRVRLFDDAGRSSSDESIFRLTAIADEPPKVKVVDPARDVMAARDQKVTLKLEASDDWGVAEVGIVSTVTSTPERITIQRPAKGTKELQTSYDVDLSLRGLKGGEIVTYYAFAVDNDGVDGPQETVGEIRYLETYDVQRYGMQGPPMNERTPKAVQEVNRLIKRQMDLTQRTFDIPRSAKDVPAESAAASAEQERLKRDVDDFITAVEKELLPGEDGEPPPMRPEELLELNRASMAMAEATGRLTAGEPRAAAAPQSQAIASLSRTRRIMLSNSGEGGGSRQAMEDAGRERQQQRQQQRRQNLDEMDREMDKLPPILKQQEEARRKLEQLEDEPPPQAEVADAAREQRRLAEQARQSAAKMDSMSRGAESQMSDKPARKLLEAAEQMERAADAAERREFGEASEAAQQAEDELAAAQSAGRQSMREIDRQRIQGAASQAEELSERQNTLADQQGEATKRADEQEKLAAEFKDLMKEVESLAKRAEREGRPEADALEDARFGPETSRAEQNMQEAARMLRGGDAGESRNNQKAAASSMSRLSRNLDSAAEQANSSAQREMAEAVKRAERLAKEIGQLEQNARDPAHEPQGMSGDAERLRDEAKGLARAASAFPSRGADSPVKQAEREFDRAGRELERAGREFARPDRASAAESAQRAKEDAQKAAAAIRDAAFGDMAGLLAEARDAAGRSARRQTDARTSLDAADPKEGADKLDAARQEAARAEAGAEAESRAASRKLSAAAGAAASLGSEIAELLDREISRGKREGQPAEMEILPSEMAALASQLGAPSPAEPEDSGEGVRDERRKARGLERRAKAAAGRLEALAAEARDDELEALRAASEDAAALSRGLAELNRSLANAESRGGEAEASPQDRAEAQRLKSEAKGLDEDAKSLRGRVERRAGELLRGSDGTGKPLDEKVDAAESEIAKIATMLSRGQPPRPSNNLRAASEAYQVLGEGIVERIERIIKEREYRPPENEDAPPEYRDLVERYFRALSED